MNIYIADMIAFKVQCNDIILIITNLARDCKGKNLFLKKIIFEKSIDGPGTNIIKLVYPQNNRHIGPIA